jgi:hypothetical protein
MGRLVTPVPHDAPPQPSWQLVLVVIAVIVALIFTVHGIRAGW